MPEMRDPSGTVHQVDDVYVVGARLNFFEAVPGGGGGGHDLPDDHQQLEEGDPPSDPDFMSDPQSCEDIAYLLQDYMRRRDSYDDLREYFEGFASVRDTIDLLHEIFFAAGIVGIAGVFDRWVAIRNAVQQASTRFIARLGAAAYAGSFVLICLYLSTLGTKGRWDVRIATLQSLAEEWNCDIQ